MKRLMIAPFVILGIVCLASNVSGQWRPKPSTKAPGARVQTAAPVSPSARASSTASGQTKPSGVHTAAPVSPSARASSTSGSVRTGIGVDRAQIGTSILPVKYHLVAEWGRTTDDVRCELTPTAIDVDPLGEIFVVEPGERNRIVIYDSAKLRANPCEIIGTIGVAGTLNHIDSFYITAFGGPSSLSFPQGVAVNKDGTYAYVADSWHNLIKKYKILREGPDNKITKSDLDPVKNVYSRMLPWQVTLNHPQGVAVVTYDQKDYVFVADTANNRVVAYVTEGDGPFNFVTYYGADASGKSNGQFVSPQGIAVDGDGELYVSDTLGNRVLKIKVVDGSIAKTFGLCDPDNPQCPASLSAPWGIVVDSSFNVFVADKAHDRVVKFDRDGKVKAIIGGEENSDEFHLNEPLGVAVDASGRVYIADSKNFRIVVVGPSL